MTEGTGLDRPASIAIEQWSAYLKELHARIAHHFQRPEVKTRAYRYLTGLLADVRRKNSWQMAEAIGEVRPRGVQHLLNDARSLGHGFRARRPQRLRGGTPRRREERRAHRG
jgi:hypothetical protein